MRKNKCGRMCTSYQCNGMAWTGSTRRKSVQDRRGTRSHSVSTSSMCCSSNTASPLSVSHKSCRPLFPLVHSLLSVPVGICSYSMSCICTPSTPSHPNLCLLSGVLSSGAHQRTYSCGPGRNHGLGWDGQVGTRRRQRDRDGWDGIRFGKETNIKGCQRGTNGEEIYREGGRIREMSVRISQRQNWPQRPHCMGTVDKQWCIHSDER